MRITFSYMESGKEEKSVSPRGHKLNRLFRLRLLESHLFDIMGFIDCKAAHEYVASAIVGDDSLKNKQKYINKWLFKFTLTNYMFVHTGILGFAQERNSTFVVF